MSNEEGDLEMGAADAYQHTDGYRNHDGSDVVYGVKKVGKWGLTENLSVPYSVYLLKGCLPCDCYCYY